MYNSLASGDCTLDPYMMLILPLEKLFEIPSYYALTGNDQW